MFQILPKDLQFLTQFRKSITTINNNLQKVAFERLRR